jgi:hypothetical protein
MTRKRQQPRRIPDDKPVLAASYAGSMNVLAINIRADADEQVTAIEYFHDDTFVRSERVPRPADYFLVRNDVDTAWQAASAD